MMKRIQDKRAAAASAETPIQRFNRHLALLDDRIRAGKYANAWYMKNLWKAVIEKK